MTSPLSQEQRAELVAKAKAATPGPWFHCQPSMVVPKQRTIHGPVPARRVDYVSTWADMGTPPGHRVVLPMPGEEGPSVRSLDMAFIAAANPDTILAYEATVVAAEAKLAVQAGARLAWPQAARDELAAWEEKHDLYVVSSDHHAGFVDQVDRLTEERDASLERVKEADEFAAFVARHSGPARRAGLSDKEFRSIVEHHPAVQDLLTKSTEQEDG